MVNALTGQQYRERYRPQYHYSPPQWWLNDPNGLVYYEGEYHLFYQYHPYATVWGPMHWGHAVSTDLVRWETLPIALYPDDIGTIFSGCIVIDADNTSGLVPGGGLVAVYSYNTQQQGVAYSIDKGRTWTKYPGNPVMEAVKKDFRDPKVFWHDETGRWVMVIAAGDTVQLYTSPNLTAWTFASEITHGHSDGWWEVPDLVRMSVDGEEYWLLIISISTGGPADGSATRYMIGQFDGTTFTDAYPDETLWFDYGPDNYAGTTFSNAPGDDPLFIGWMNNWLYANEIPTEAWRGQLTLPRRLRLVNTAAGVRLSQQPAAEIEQLRQPLGTWTDTPIVAETSPEGLTGPALELTATFEAGTAQTFGFHLFGGVASRVRVVYDVAERQLVVHRLGEGMANYRQTFAAPLPLVDGTLTLRVLIDHSTLEIFAHGGQVSMTALVFPDVDAVGVSVVAEGGRAALRSLDAFSLGSIWES